MDLKAQFIALISNNVEYVIISIFFLVVFTLGIFLYNLVKMNKMHKRYRAMMRGMEQTNLEETLIAHIEELRGALAQVKSLKEDCQRLDTTTSHCLQNINLVRYNAFENTGSDLSFALAMLDSHNNGVVVSSLFGRNESRVYAKPIVNGQSTYFLTDEEQLALQKAGGKK